MGYTVATSVDGPLEVHRDGCPHIARLYAEGGGSLSNGHTTIGEARHAALQDCDNVVIQNCAIRPRLTNKQKGELAGDLIREAPRVASEFLEKYPNLPMSVVTDQLAKWLKDLPGSDWDVRLGPAPY